MGEEMNTSGTGNEHLFLCSWYHLSPCPTPAGFVPCPRVCIVTHLMAPAGGAYSQQAITAQQGEVSLCHLSHVSVLPIPCPWQAARSQQAIAAQRGEVALVERAQRAQLQEQEVGRRRQELEATVRKPAEAERYRLERLAEAQR